MRRTESSIVVPRILERELEMASEQGYAVDERTVYSRGDVLQDADAASFTVLGAPDNGADARDARNRYGMGKRMAAAP